MKIRLDDNECGTITIYVDGKEIRSWSYPDNGHRMDDDVWRQKMALAHEFYEGWYQCAKKYEQAILTWDRTDDEATNKVDLEGSRR